MIGACAEGCEHAPAWGSYKPKESPRTPTLRHHVVFTPKILGVMTNVALPMQATIRGIIAKHHPIQQHNAVTILPPIFVNANKRFEFLRCGFGSMPIKDRKH